MVGYKPVNGSSDPECTHVILTLDEYDELHQRIRAAINDGKRAKDEAARAAAASAANAEKAVKKIQDEAAQEIAQLKKKVETERAGKEYQIGLNQDFKRIARERANADRGIKPKKNAPVMWCCPHGRKNIGTKRTGTMWRKCTYGKP